MTDLLSALVGGAVGLAVLGLTVLVVVLAVSLVLSAGRPRWVRRTAAGLGLVAVAAVVVRVILWGRGFDEADALREVPPVVTYGGDVAVVVFLVCGVALGALAPVRERRAYRP